MKIIVAIDGSSHSSAVVEAIAGRHFPADSEVRIISVVVPPPAPGMLAMEGVSTSLYVEIENTARTLAHAALSRAAAAVRAGAEGRVLKVTTEVLSGHAARAIIEDAEMFGADLIVVGSHSQGTFERFLLGSVSHAVALHAKCSVEIVRSPRTHANNMK